MKRDQLLAQIKTSLRDVFGKRLQGIVLYGSEARGEAKEDSDIDVLVLLDGPIALGKDLDIIIHALYPLQLEILRPLHAMPVNAESYYGGEYALYRNVKEEGVAA